MGPGEIGETRTRAPAPRCFLEICSNCLASQAKQGQQNAFESEFASAAIKPFLQSMRAAAGATAADGNRFKSERQRNVGIGGGTLNLGGVSELRVHRADDLQDVGVGAEFASGAIANRHQFAT